MEENFEDRKIEGKKMNEQIETRIARINTNSCKFVKFVSFIFLSSIFLSFFFLPLLAQGVIMDFKQLRVEFTNSAEATNKATWAESLTITSEGLGWDGESAGVRSGWIETRPLAVGTSWRAPGTVSVRVAVQPAAREITSANGQKSTPDAGDAYVRYSPDKQHWSSWQALQRSQPTNRDDKSARCYEAKVSVPERDRAEYGRLLSEYSTLDVPWKSDEEAAVHWILERDPEFFSKQIPFMGYVEFLFEGSFYGGQRVRSFKAEVWAGMSGLHAIPRDQGVYTNRDSPWRFEGTGK
ncbi:MAG: hypothetical protein C5B50_03380 [Verrucomicrobia bacterium]|nr:MAG: hypothetical protein C5B50_03380 [Verrucomicrobiota bacterium]